VGAIVAQVFARRHPARLSGLFFFNCPHSGIGSRWISPNHVPEVWYQTFNCLPWSAAMVHPHRASSLDDVVTPLGLHSLVPDRMVQSVERAFQVAPAVAFRLG
jgi:pimeloyl-ACP methyl ester carboxylesterase